MLQISSAFLKFHEINKSLLPLLVDLTKKTAILVSFKKVFKKVGLLWENILRTGDKLIFIRYNI